MRSSTSPISRAARPGSRPATRRASPAFTVMVVSEWPSRSWRSRAIRVRSFSAARRATSARASLSSRFAFRIVKKPNIASDTSGSVSSIAQSGSASHAGIAAGRNVANSVIATIARIAPRPCPAKANPAMISTAMNTHITKASSRAIGISRSATATISANQRQ